MKKLFWVILLSLPLLSRSQSASDGNGILWTAGLNWGQIKEKAKKESKFIFVDAYATWCVPCKIMDKEVYADKSIGEVINPRFISIRMQMDKTKRDNEEVRKWYPTVQEFNEQYSIEGYPSFLFFNSDGKLVHKALGLHDISAFVALAKEAMSDPETRYQASIEKFRAGLLDYFLMSKVARQAREKADSQLAIEIAKHFKEKYLDKLQDNEVFTKQNLAFLAEFSSELLKTSDRYFQFFYWHPILADSIIDSAVYGRKHVAEIVAVNVITKEEIGDKMYLRGKPITEPEPNWYAIRKSVKKKYDDKYYHILFPDAEISFYEDAKDWKNLIKYVNKRMRKYPPHANGSLFGSQFGDVWTVNHWAWVIFKGCNDRRLLRKAVLWADLAIDLESNPSIKANYIDTKANLLYKMENKEQAIELQKKAVELSKNNKTANESFHKILAKMKAGLPTWPVEDEL